MSRPVHRLLAALAAFALAAVVPAAEADKIIYPGATAAAASLPTGQSGGMGAFTIVGILLLGGAGGWMLWRNRSKMIPGQDARKLVIAETRSLGSRQYIVVASYEGKKFLLGVCPGRIDLLAPLDASGSPVGGKSL